ncbi:hypothetical protein [Pseudoxanthomonas indica]|uniref:Uncharacterized protein n=1 Tax=Pseudoxanthomonas indica TaxID=428993 RepID=A0A1T5K1X3_9GAMM|nr:hypothetical protein [Pseudoxanthomonas indica]GGD45915.1 hypothetical protein GCM10007235_17370 [Pseudoxanthomonas indica]SKC57479.1 hypothetical protein SAMN06296058_1275 [Pseudoxanthomonas indica]
MKVVTKSRARAVRQFVARHPNGVTVAQIIQGVDRACTASAMSATLAPIVARGQVRRKVRGGEVHFLPTKSTVAAPTPAATQAVPPKPIAKAVPASLGAKPSPMAQHQSADPLRVDTALASRVAGRVNLSSLYLKPKHRQLDRTEITADVERFIASGGAIQKLDHGDTAESIKAREERFRAEQRQRSAIPPHRRAKSSNT